MDASRRARHSRSLGVYLVATLLGLASLVLAYRLWEADLRVPLNYTVGWDCYYTLKTIQTIRETGWYIVNPRLGAPGVCAMYDFPFFDAGTTLTIKAMLAVIPDESLVYNLDYFLTFFLAIWSALFVFRRFGVSDPLAIVASLLFGFAPFHFWRGMWHLSFSAYYTIPLVAMVGLWISGGEPLFLRRDPDGRLRPRWTPGKSWPSLLACVLVGLSNPYYIAFGAFFLGVSGLISLARRPSLPRLLDLTLALGLVVGIAFVQSLPFVIHRVRHGENPEVAQRSLPEIQAYGLHVVALLRPTYGHRLSGLLDARYPWSSQRRQSSLFYKSFHLNEGDICSPLGFVGLCGFVVLVYDLLRSGGRGLPASPLRADLSVLNVAGISLAVVGGFNEVVAEYLTTMFRAYNRMSIYLGFFAILALSLAVEESRRRRGWSGWRYHIALAFGLVVALLDQVPAVIVPNYANEAALFHRDREFMVRVEESAPPRGMIFQLPDVPFPENAPVFGMNDYDHFRGYFHSKTLRWSYGALKGQPVARWQRWVAALPAPEMMFQLSKAGFSGIYLNREGYPSTAEADDLANRIAIQLGQRPIVSEDGRLLFFRIPDPTPGRGSTERRPGF